MCSIPCKLELLAKKLNERSIDLGSKVLDGIALVKVEILRECAEVIQSVLEECKTRESSLQESKELGPYDCYD